MALFEFAPQQMRSTALVLNILVSAIAFIHYNRIEKLNIRLFMVLIIASVPAAFIGGSITINTLLYKYLLGIFLLFPAYRLAGGFVSEENYKVNDINYPIAFFAAIVIGFISGLIGIGGGILLSPLLLIWGWSNMKQTATISSLFIFVNSIAGLAGNSRQSINFDSQLILMSALAFAGGMAGAYYGSKHFNFKVLRFILAIVLLIASAKLLLA